MPVDLRKHAERVLIRRRDDGDDCPKNPGDAPTANQPTTNQDKTGPDLQRLLTSAGPQRVGNLTTKTESARTTFRLGTEAEALFDRLSGRTGKSKKELLGSALRLSREGWDKSPETFEKAAGSLQVEGAIRIPMAIAQRTRKGLNDLRDDTGIARDRLVEIGIRLAEADFERQVRRRIRPHRDVLEDLGALYEETEAVQLKLSGHEMRSDGWNALRDDRDPIERALLEILHILTEMRDAIEKEVDSGQPIGAYREFL